MPIMKKTGSLLAMAALAASTTLSGPSFAYAQAKAVRVAQASADEIPAAEPEASGDAVPLKRKPKAEAEAEAAPSPAEAAEEAPPKKRPAKAEAPAEGAPAEEPAPPKPRPAKAEAPAAEAPAEEPAPPKKRPAKAEAPADAAPGDESAPPKPRPAKVEAPAAEAPAEEPAPPKKRPAKAEAPADAAPGDESAPPKPRPAKVEAPAAEAPTEEPAPPKKRPAKAEAPADAAPGDESAPPKPRPAKVEAPAAEAPAEPAPLSEPEPEAAPTAEAPAAAARAEAPAKPRQPKADGSKPGKGKPAAAAAEGLAQPAPAGTEPAGTVPAAPPMDAASPPAGAAAPVAEPGAPPAAAADGGKRRPSPPAPSGTEATPANAPPVAETPKPVPLAVQNAPVERGKVEQSDARAQTLSRPVVEQPIAAERGERLQEAPTYEQPPESKVVKRVGNRDIMSIVGAAAAGAAVGAATGYFIRSNDDDRLAVDSREQYHERLPRGRTRDTIVRPNGSQVVTITNEYGDVVQRSRIDPDGREVVLFYDPYSEDDRPRPDYYDDPGEDLPPLELNIPRDRYIVDTDQPDEELYFDTIVAPPVETVERIYSVDEVRRSERIRDKVRRIDVNTITFDFGSATISQAEVKNLKALADAVSRVIKDNPGETFLIEGHTDAVGSNVANLALSDQRAESVAAALTQYFDIPSENLITQGYGEEDLKVNTQEENRENRRVTLRRITALVKPVTAAAK